MVRPVFAKKICPDYTSDPMKFLSLLTVFFAFAAHADSWNGNNQPSNMGKYNYAFEQLPLSGMVETPHMPWSDNYWESDWGGISLRWNTLTSDQLDPEGHSYVDKYSLFQYTPPTREQAMAMTKEQLKKLSPAEKYDLLMGRYDYPTVRSERQRTGPGYDDWQGICHGWVPASINHPEPLPTEATNPDGIVVPFGSTDVKGLLSYYYGVPSYDFARGHRKVIRNGDVLQYLDQFDLSDVKKWVAIATGATVWNDGSGYSVSVNSMKDASDCTDDACREQRAIRATVEDLNLVGQVGVRPKKGGIFGTSGITDPNAGAFHVVMANQLGLMKLAFVGNINKKIKNAEVWNQPIVGYNTRIDRDHRRNNGSGTVDVTTTLSYVNESPQQWEPVIGTPLQRIATYTFSYTLELDSYGNITGGEWASRAVHPSFIWKHDKLEIRGYMSKLNEIYHSRF
jgi:hypothetical protein